VETYRYFDEVFEQLLQTRNFTPYRLACHQVTLRFAELSRGVRLVRECLGSVAAAATRRRGGTSNGGSGEDNGTGRGHAASVNDGVAKGPEAAGSAAGPPSLDSGSSTSGSGGNSWAAPFGDLCTAITALQDAEKRKLEVTAQLQLLRQHAATHGDRRSSRGGHSHDHGHDDHDHDGGDDDDDADDPQQQQVSLEDLGHAIHIKRAILAEIVEEIRDVLEEVSCERASMEDDDGDE
jgi:hypothetical protein